MLILSGIPKTTEFREDGFTLVELMVAIVIFSFVMFMLFSSFSAFVSSSQAISGNVRDCEAAMAAFRRISDDLKSVYVVPAAIYKNRQPDNEPDPFRLQGELTTTGGKSFSRLEFASFETFGTGAKSAGNIAKVTYYVRHSRDGRFDLMRSERPPEQDWETDECLDPVLLDDISGFDLSFMDTAREDTRLWDSDDVKHQLPAVILISLELNREKRKRVYSTAVFLPVNRDAID